MQKTDGHPFDLPLFARYDTSKRIFTAIQCLQTRSSSDVKAEPRFMRQKPHVIH
jgi:hypothetical protein